MIVVYNFNSDSGIQNNKHKLKDLKWLIIICLFQLQKLNLLNDSKLLQVYSEANSKVSRHSQCRKRKREEK